MRHLFDPEKQVGKVIENSLNWEDRIAWDIYLSMIGVRNGLISRQHLLTTPINSKVPIYVPVNRISLGYRAGPQQ
jgi:hypothetical protein